MTLRGWSTEVEFQIGGELRGRLETDAPFAAHEAIDDRLRNTAALGDGILCLAAALDRTEKKRGHSTFS